MRRSLGRDKAVIKWSVHMSNVSSDLFTSFKGTSDKIMLAPRSLGRGICAVGYSLGEGWKAGSVHLVHVKLLIISVLCVPLTKVPAAYENPQKDQFADCL